MKVKTAIIDTNVNQSDACLPEWINNEVKAQIKRLVKRITKQNSKEENSDYYNVVRSISVFASKNAIHIVVGYTEEEAGC